MKKLSLFLCCLLILQMLCACGDKKEEFREPVNFYYYNREISYNSASGVIQPEIREGSGFYGNLNAFLHAYLMGPKSSELQTVIPSDVYLVSCESDDDTVTIEFNSQFAGLSGTKLTIACSAILMSVHDYTGADTIVIRAKDTKIDDKNEFVISMDDIVLLDTVTTVE